MDRLEGGGGEGEGEGEGEGGVSAVVSQGVWQRETPGDSRR